MWNEEEQENAVEQKDTLYDNDPVRAQARNTAEKAAKQKKEIEDRLRQNIEEAQKKAKAKTERLISDAAEKQKQETLEKLQKSPDELNNTTQPDFSNVSANIATSVSAEMSSEIAYDSAVSAPQGMETELPQTAYDTAYKDQYDETARLIGAQTDAARESEPSKAGDNRSVEGVISEMSEELQKETNAQTMQMDNEFQRETRSAHQESTLNRTLQEHSEWSTLDAKQGRSHDGLSVPRRSGNMPDKLQKDADLLAMAKEYGIDKALEYAKQSEQKRMTVEPLMKRHGQDGGR